MSRLPASFYDYYGMWNRKAHLTVWGTIAALLGGLIGGLAMSNQPGCTHDWVYVGDETIGGRKYRVYKCSKCGYYDRQQA